MIRALLTALLIALLAACQPVVREVRHIPEPMAADTIDRAEAALRDGEVDRALQLLGSEREQVARAERGRWARLRAEALSAQGEHFEAARQLALVDADLSRADQAANRAEIDRLLARLPDGDLSANAAMLPDGHPLYPFAGRALTSRGLPLPRAYDRDAFAEELLALRPPAAADGYRPPRQLAVLLPMSGPLAAAAESVRDGILAAHFQEQRQRPQIRFYDTGGSEAGSIDAYQLATADGADQVLGPLSREEVSALLRQGGLQVPVLALNRSAEPGPPGSASFALSPEEEGIAAAERLLQRGHSRIITVTADDDSARRSLDAFRVRFQERGGVILAEARIDERMVDYGPALQIARQEAGGASAHDALFLAVRAPQGRLLVPQLAVAGFPARPIAATSQILLGSGDPRQDRELDGIEFPETPWILGRFDGLPDATRLGRELDSAAGPRARLFAFGFDAYRLVGYLDHLGRAPSEWINGATGELRVDGFGNVLRSPGWGVFSGGRPRPALDGLLTPETVGRE
ncbi:MAG: penicillin-binding protein activator [Lysobacteraceae bacterium]